MVLSYGFAGGNFSVCAFACVKILCILMCIAFLGWLAI